MQRYEWLRNDVEHVIFRFPRQWDAVFGAHAQDVCGGHSRTACLPTGEEVVTQLSQLRSRLESMRLLLSSLNPDASQPLIGVKVDDLVGEVSQLCAADSAQLALKYPELIGDRVQQLAKQVHCMGIICGVFDKRLHVLSGVCRKMMDTHLLLDVVLGPKFKVWGWGCSVKRAKVLAVKEIVNRARHHGVLAQACSLNLGHPDLLVESSAERFFTTLLSTDSVTVRLTPPLSAPTLFSMLKWTSIESGVDPLIKWREVIAFCSVPLKRYARVIGRCLQLLVKALYLECPTLGFPLMLGTRDFSQACIRLSSQTSAVHICEQDMQDM